MYWLHDFEEEPYRLVSEIGEDEYETRKLEFFRAGEVGYAFSEAHTANTMLGTMEVPMLEEINSQSEFQGKNISRHEFDRLWKQHVRVSG